MPDEAGADRDGVGLRTERLLLRSWRAEDLGPFAALNADPEVMRHFPAAMGREQSDALASRAQTELDERGYGLWALEVVAGPHAGCFAGFTGLSVPTFEAAFTPCVEVGWRLTRWAWGRGYATEAGVAALRYGFMNAGLNEVVSFTVAANLRSQAVMGRLGMIRDPADDFYHPNMPEGSPLRRHVLYRLPRQRWQQQGD
jgi:RimJ/RimL family protein N-acetyltransferase